MINSIAVVAHHRPETVVEIVAIAEVAAMIEDVRRLVTIQKIDDHGRKGQCHHHRRPNQIHLK